MHLLPAPGAAGARAGPRRAPERELVRPGAGPEHGREQLQRLLGPAVLGVPGDHGRPGHDAPVRHPVEHPACGRDVAEVGVEHDELGAQVGVRRRGGSRDDGTVVHRLALTERVSADAALEQRGVERGGGFRGIGKAHCWRVLFDTNRSIASYSCLCCVEVAREGSGRREGCRSRGRQRRWWRVACLAGSVETH